MTQGRFARRQGGERSEAAAQAWTVQSPSPRLPSRSTQMGTPVRRAEGFVRYPLCTARFSISPVLQAHLHQMQAALLGHPTTPSEEPAILGRTSSPTSGAGTTWPATSTRWSGAPIGRGMSSSRLPSFEIQTSNDPSAGISRRPRLPTRGSWSTRCRPPARAEPDAGPGGRPPDLKIPGRVQDYPYGRLPPCSCSGFSTLPAVSNVCLRPRTGERGDEL